MGATPALGVESRIADEQVGAGQRRGGGRQHEQYQHEKKSIFHGCFLQSDFWHNPDDLRFDLRPGLGPVRAVADYRNDVIVGHVPVPPRLESTCAPMPGGTGPVAT